MHDAALCRTEPPPHSKEPPPPQSPQLPEPTDAVDRTAETEAPTPASEPHSKPESPTEVFESEESSSPCHFSELTDLPAPSEVPSPDQQVDDRT